MLSFALPSVSRSSAQLRKFAETAISSQCSVSRSALSIAVLLFLFAAMHLMAQTGLATLSGTITDPSGAIITKANVTVTNEATGVAAKTETTGAGVYVVEALPPGMYRVLVEHQGFKQIEVEHLELHTQDTISRNFVLPVGAASETIQVSGNQSTVNDSPAVSLTVEREFVENMPLNGQSFQDLIQLAPGTVDDGRGYYSIDGQRTDSNNFTVDGVSANLGGINNYSGEDIAASLSGSAPMQTALGTTQPLASVDDLQEFKIQTSGYAAEFGRNPGGQVQLTTRSGTNNVHGTLFDYLRNTDFDANSFYNDYYKQPQTAEHQNDFGGSFGGPLLVPRLYDGRDKTFFFLSYEGLRLLLPSYTDQYNPTQAFRNAANVNVQTFLDAFPLPNEGINSDGCTTNGSPTGPACDGIFYADFSYPNNLENYTARIDHDFGDRFHGFIRYADTPSSVTLPGNDPSGTITNIHSWTAGLTSKLSDRLLDELRFNYSRDGEQQNETLASFYGSIPYSRSLVIPPVDDSAFAVSELYLTIPNSSIYSILFYQATGSQVRQYQIVDSLTWTKGAHSIKFGVDWRRIDSSAEDQPYESFIGINALSDAQNGYATQLSTSAAAPAEPIFHNLSLYAQDHWKMNRRLTLDYGLRWDINPPPSPSDGIYPVALTSDDLTTATLTNSGTSPYSTDLHSLGPRIGFAWNAVPTQAHAITVRGGIGIFWDTAQQAIAQAFYYQYPYYASSPNYSEVALPLTASELAPPSLNTTLTPPYDGDLDLTSPDLTAPYTINWNISVDEAINQKNTFTASYVGNLGRDLLYTHFYPRGISGNPDFSTGLRFTNNGSLSNYNALQVQDAGRIVNGMDLVGSFTWAHALDNASNDFSSFFPFYGNSDNDLRRVLNLALNYQMPGVGLGRWMHGITSGWTLANRFSAQSGYPVNIIESYVVSATNYTIYSPDLVPGVPIYLHGNAASSSLHNWQLNRAAFLCTTASTSTGLGATSGACTGTPTQEGSLGRNYVRDPAFWDLNSSVQRTFPIHEQLHLNFRADAFNIFNHPNLGDPNNTVSSSTFGELGPTPTTIGSANALYAMGAARSLQFSLKLVF
jgi:hypothetical protein